MHERALADGFAQSARYGSFGISTLVLCHSLILGLAVLALATVWAAKTGASAQTADSVNPTF